jgi:hypothetical protein
VPLTGTYATVQPCDLSCTATEALDAEPAVALGGIPGSVYKNGRPVDLARDWRLRRAARGDELIEAHVFDGHDGAFTKGWASDWSSQAVFQLPRPREQACRLNGRAGEEPTHWRSRRACPEL